MDRETIREDIQYIHELLNSVFNDIHGFEVKKEWNIKRGAGDNPPEMYYPRIDFAIGPFNLTNAIKENVRDINNAYTELSLFFGVLIQNDAYREFPFNPDSNGNPRCLAAIEIENKCSAKHRMSSMHNALSLGKVGIVIAANDEAYRNLIRIRSYLEFLGKKGKVPSPNRNTLILDIETFKRILDDTRRRLVVDE
jgi:hypothetical protein